MSTPSMRNSPHAERGSEHAEEVPFPLRQHGLTPHELEQVCSIFIRIAMRIQERNKQAIQETDMPAHG